MADLFSPLEIGDLHLPNRIVMAPLTRSRATVERVPTPMMAEHYVQRAAAGRGAIWSNGSVNCRFHWWRNTACGCGGRARNGAR